jgi:hypothetical protein
MFMTGSITPTTIMEGNPNNCYSGKKKIKEDKKN